MIELDPSYVGSVCELTSMTNELVCMGRLRQVPSPDNEFMLAVVSRSDNFPMLAYRSTLKVHIRCSSLHSIFLVGKVEVSKRDLIELRDIKILAEDEKRDAFRVGFTHTAPIYLKKERRKAGAIRFQDISMGGFMCQSNSELIRHKVYTVEVPLGDGLYLMDFQVVRNLPSSKEGVFVYGCQFLNVQDKLLDTLAHFVFSLQKEKMGRLNARANLRT